MSVRAVADAVGVSPPSIYIHFEDKDRLLLAVCEAQYALFDAYVQGAVEGIEDPMERLAARGRAYVRFGVEHPAHYRVLFMAPTSAPPDIEMRQATGFGRLIDDVEECMATGRFAPADSLLVATGLWATVHGVTSLAIARPDYPYIGSDDLLDHLMGVYVRGLADESSSGGQAPRSRTSGRDRGRRP